MPHQDTRFTILNAARLIDGTGAPGGSTPASFPLRLSLTVDGKT